MENRNNGKLESWNDGEGKEKWKVGTYDDN
jgi:hypothetical protein